MKKILLYSPIYSYTAEAFVNKLLEVDPSEDLEILMNSPGGSVFAGWSIVGALAERTGKNIAKVYGDASSMAFYSLLFMDEVQCLDVSTFMVHRAEGYEENEEDKIFLAKVNKDLRSKLEAKIDVEKFTEITGKTMDELFDPNKRINVNLSAKEAKKIKLVDKVIRLEPNQLAALNEKFVAFADFDLHGSEIEEKQSQGSEATKYKLNINKNAKKMTKQEFKAQHPEIYTEVYNDGLTAGVKDEKDRIEAFLEFVEIDAESVKKQIADGSQITNKFMAEMTKKMAAAAMKKDIQAESKKTEIKELEKTEKTEAQLETEKFEKEVLESMNLKEEIK